MVPSCHACYPSLHSNSLQNVTFTGQYFPVRFSIFRAGKSARVAHNKRAKKASEQEKRLARFQSKDFWKSDSLEDRENGEMGETFLKILEHESLLNRVTFSNKNFPFSFTKSWTFLTHAKMAEKRFCSILRTDFCQL